MNIEKMCEALLCGYVTFGVVFLCCLIFFVLDFTLYCLTNQCILHTIYEIEKRLY